MSSGVFARVQALNEKAAELLDKGHLLRAAENYGRAAEAARALGADNLVAVDMQLGRCTALCAHTGAALAATDAATNPVLLAHYFAEFVVLLSGAADTLERRRVAGTLLDGKCSAVEEVWFVGELQRQNAHLPASVATSWAALVGYKCFLNAAANALRVLDDADLHAAECSAAQFHSFTRLVVHATKLMQQSRRHGDVPMRIEATFTNALRNAVADAGDFGLDARLVKFLADAWRLRLRRSGCGAAACCRRAASRSPSSRARPSGWLC